MRLTAVDALVGVLTVLTLLTTSAVGMKRICYFVNWAQYRKGNGKHTYKEIDPELCSHVIIAFVAMTEDSHQLKAGEWNDEDTESNVGVYSHVTDLKIKHPTLKVMLAVGGWNFGTAKMTAMLATKDTRTVFVNDVVRFLRTRNFDGFDLDFEYPAKRGSPPEDKARFALLCKELRERFEEEAEQTSKPRLLLSAAVGCGKSTMDAAYDVPELAKYLDWIGLMSYDMEYSSKGVTKHHSPLFPREEEPVGDKKLCIEWVVDYWMTRGAPAEKLVVGMAFYGKSFTLRSAAKHGVGDPKSGTGIQGPFTKQPGFMAYFEVCALLRDGWTRRWIDTQKVPYAYNNTQWVGYDDADSMKEKAIWAASKGLGGWMVWDLAMDDFGANYCGSGKYPLLHALNDNTPRDGVTTAPTRSTTTKGQEKTTHRRRQHYPVKVQPRPTDRRRNDIMDTPKEEDDKQNKPGGQKQPPIDDPDDTNDGDDEDDDDDDDNDDDFPNDAASTVRSTWHMTTVLAVGVTVAILTRSH